MQSQFLDIKRIIGKLYLELEKLENAIAEELPHTAGWIADRKVRSGEFVQYWYYYEDKKRKAYFDAKTKIHLMNYIESRTDNNSALFVSLNKPHSRLTESGVELRLREMGKKSGVEKVHPHKFRRTMATRAIEKGMPIGQVQKILGHEQIDTKLRYAMVNQNNVKLSHIKYIS